MDQKRNIATLNIFIFIWSFVIAVFISSFFFIPPLISVFIILIGVATLVAGKESLFISVALISFGLGILRYDIKDFRESATPSVAGFVINEPEQRENTTRFVFKSDNNEKVLVNTDLYSSVAYGDKVKINGNFKEPGVIDDGIGRPFNYAKYLAKDDIYFVMNFAKVEIISSGHGSRIKSALISLKRSFVENIRKILKEPESSLLAGLLVAGKGLLPKNVLEEFQRAGIIHVVVLSGFNITIIAEFLRKWLGPPAAIAGIILFVIMTGGEATVVRAAIMVLVVFGARLLRRPYSAPRALVSAGFLMVLHNPKILVFDASFQLSFLATCGLIYIVPKVQKYLKWEVLATTIGTQLAVLPLLIYLMREISIVSLPANVLVLPFIPYVMFAGFFATLIAYISAIIATPLTYFAHIILAWILFVAHFFGSLPFATIAVPF